MLRGKHINWLVAVAGLWMMISGFVLGYTELSTVLRNGAIVGMILLILGYMSALDDKSGLNDVMNVISSALGFWLILMPFLMGLPRLSPVAEWNNILAGLVVMAASLLALSEYIVPERTSEEI